ncbi:MAG: PglZ domain-containing protein, partial [Candidatus Cloacimonetes bacterium]|nr:PglZ domain-containing protein [Candidatus Cloacimonadota bacterium]
HKILIYLNTKRDTNNFPLIELEKAGCVIEPHGPVERNTNLTVVVKEAFSEKISEELVRDICEKIEDKTIVIDEIDKIVENAKSIDTAALSIIFNTNEPQSIILNFLADQSLDKSIQEKKLKKELSKLIHMHLGIEVKASFSLGQLRDKTIETVLMVDFIDSLKDGSVKEKYKGLDLPNKENHISSIKGIVNLWRNRSDITEEYIRESEKVQKVYGITSETFTTKDIIDVQTFSVIDKMLIDTCLTEGDTKNLSSLQEIVSKRRNAFWATKNAEYSLIWVIVEYCINLRLSIQNALEDIKQKELNLSELMDLYMGINREGWFLIDKNYRLLESKYTEFDIGSVFDDKLEKFIVRVREEYSKFLNVQSECVSLSISSSRMADTEKILKQKDILKRAVLPILQNKKKCAYFLVDAFRYEMGDELFESIENYEQRNILPVLAAIPTMTPFGMLSLLLYHNETIDVKPVNGKVMLEINGNKINSRNERLKFIEEKMPYSIETFKLDEVIKPKKSVRERVKKADILIITSQEIDSLCESGES